MITMATRELATVVVVGVALTVGDLTTATIPITARKPLGSYVEVLATTRAAVEVDIEGRKDNRGRVWRNATLVSSTASMNTRAAMLSSHTFRQKAPSRMKSPR